jgi:predicted transcriptional regulator of viral defense system
VACKRFGPRSVIGGHTALFQYGLVEEVPTQIWVLVPPTVRTSSPRYRLIRTKRNLAEGGLSKEGYRITSIERTLLDALVFASKLGERIAITATIKALRQKDTSEKKLYNLAKQMGELSILDRYWQSVLAGVSQ